MAHLEDPVWTRTITATLVQDGQLHPCQHGPKPSLHYSCLFQGVPSSPDSPAATNDKPLHLRLYVDDFVYFSEDSAIENRFERLLAAKLKVEFMGTVNWFLGTHFGWSSHQDGALSCHLSWEAYV